MCLGKTFETGAELQQTIATNLANVELSYAVADGKTSIDEGMATAPVSPILVRAEGQLFFS